MNCFCYDLTSGDHESCVVMSDCLRKARKGHLCYGCGRTILKGETYRYETLLICDGYKKHKTCADCNSVREHLLCNFYSGSIWDDLREIVYEGGDYPWEKISKLTVTAREKICDMIEKYWEKQYPAM